MDNARKLCYTVAVAYHGKGAAVLADVFISYHEKSAGEIVRQIADALEKEGITCWYAQRDLIGPGSFAAIIAREIRNCKVFLLVMNEESNQSEHVKNEIGVAFHRISEHEKMSLALFRLDNCKLPDELYYYLNRFQITDGNPPDEEHIKKLVEQIPRIIDHSAESSITSPTWEMIRARDRRIADLHQQLLQQYRAMNQAKAQSKKRIQALYQDKARILDLYRKQAQDKAQTKNHKKIIISFLIVISLLVSGVIGYLCNHTIGILDRSGTLRIYGIGSITTVSYPFQSVTNSEVSSIIIPSSITSIENDAFRSHAKLTTVIIPDSVSVIERGAFLLCPNLKSVSVPTYAQVDTLAFSANTHVVRRPSPE